MQIVHFTPNEPQELTLGSQTSPVALPNGSGCLYTLSDGRTLHLGASVAQSLADLRLGPGENFRVCLHQNGNGLGYWSVWLSPDTEKARAAAKLQKLERQLVESLELVSRRKVRGTPAMLATGTDGPLPSRKPALAAVAGGRREKSGADPCECRVRGNPGLRDAEPAGIWRAVERSGKTGSLLHGPDKWL